MGSSLIADIFSESLGQRGAAPPIPIGDTQQCIVVAACAAFFTKDREYLIEAVLLVGANSSEVRCG